MPDFQMIRRRMAELEEEERQGMNPDTIVQEGMQLYGYVDAEMKEGNFPSLNDMVGELYPKEDRENVMRTMHFDEVFGSDEFVNLDSDTAIDQTMEFWNRVMCPRIEKVFPNATKDEIDNYHLDFVNKILASRDDRLNERVYEQLDDSPSEFLKEPEMDSRLQILLKQPLTELDAEDYFAFFAGAEYMTGGAGEIAGRSVQRLRSMPFMGDVAHLKYMADVAAASWRLSNSPHKRYDGDERDALIVKAYMQKAEADKTFWYHFHETASQLPAYMGEFIATSGFYTVGKLAARKAAQKGLEWMFKKKGARILDRRLAQIVMKYGVEPIAGTATRFPIFAPLKVPAEMKRRMMPEFSNIPDENDIVVGINIQEGEGFDEAFVKALGSEYIEEWSEMMGGSIRWLPKAFKGGLVKLGMIKAIQKSNKGMLLTEAKKIVETVGYHGIGEEFYEERLADVARAIFGIEEFQIHSLKQYLSEIAVFALPGAAFYTAGKVAGRKDQLATEAGAKKLIERLKKEAGNEEHNRLVEHVDRMIEQAPFSEMSMDQVFDKIERIAGRRVRSYGDIDDMSDEELREVNFELDNAVLERTEEEAKIKYLQRDIKYAGIYAIELTQEIEDVKLEAARNAEVIEGEGVSKSEAMIEAVDELAKNPPKGKNVAIQLLVDAARRPEAKENFDQAVHNEISEKEAETAPPEVKLERPAVTEADKLQNEVKKLRDERHKLKGKKDKKSKGKRAGLSAQIDKAEKQLKEIQKPSPEVVEADKSQSLAEAERNEKVDIFDEIYPILAGEKAEPIKTARFKAMQEDKTGVEHPLFDIYEGEERTTTVLGEDAVRELGLEVPEYEKKGVESEPTMEPAARGITGREVGEGERREGGQTVRVPAPARRDIPSDGAGSVGVRSSVVRTARWSDESRRFLVSRSEHTTDVVDPGTLGDLSEYLNPIQVQGVIKAINQMDVDEGFLLADGTGVGKTREILAVAEYYRTQGFGVQIVAPSETFRPNWTKNTMSGSYAADGDVMGVEISLNTLGLAAHGTINLTSYHYLGKNAIKVDGSTILIFDEAHYMKNASSGRGTAGVDAINKAKAVLFSTATPGDKGEHFHYLMRIGISEGKSYEKMMYELGYTQRKFRNKRTWVVNSSIGTITVNNHINALFNRMTAQDRMIRRELSWEGIDVDFQYLTPPADLLQVMDDIRTEFDRRGGGWTSKGQMIMSQRLHQEPFKVPYVIDMVKEELAAGRKAIIFLNRINKSDLLKKDTSSNRRGETISENINVVASTPGSADLLKRELQKAGISSIAEIHGNAEGKSTDEMDRFQAGGADVCIATILSGGTGINLDDREGNQPRTVIMMTAPWTANEVVQAAGRAWRMTSKSKPRVRFLYMETTSDLGNAAVLNQKLQTLHATVNGEVAVFDEMKEAVRAAPVKEAEAKPAKAEAKPATELEPSQNYFKVPIETIKINTELLQSREQEFAEETVQSIVETEDLQEVLNRMDPVVIWKNPEDNKYYLLSGHSRLEGLRRREETHIDAQIFEGTMEDVMAAKSKWNRQATAETWSEDVKVYNDMKQRGASKEEIHAVFRGREGYISRFSGLNPRGSFMEMLNRESRGMNLTEFPGFKARAGMMGDLRKKYPDKLTDAHEEQVFKFLYGAREEGDKTTAQQRYSLMLKDEIAEMIEKQVSGAFWNLELALVLEEKKKQDMPEARGRSDTRDIMKDIDKLRLQKEEALTVPEVEEIQKEIDRRMKAVHTMIKQQGDFFGEADETTNLFDPKIQKTDDDIITGGMNKLGMNPMFDIQFSGALFRTAVRDIQAGMKSFVNWTAKMRKQFGDWIRPYLAGSYKMATNYIQADYKAHDEGIELMYSGITPASAYNVARRTVEKASKWVQEGNLQNIEGLFSRFRRLLCRFPHGVKHARVITDLWTETGLRMGEPQKEKNHITNALNRKEYQWNASNYKAWIEGGSKLDDQILDSICDKNGEIPKNILEFDKIYRRIMKFYDEGATNAGIMVKEEDGTLVPFAPMKNYFPVQLHDRVRRAILLQRGVDFKVIVAWADANNVNMKDLLTLADPMDAPVDRKFGALESHRVANLPDKIDHPDGGQMEFLNTNVFEVMDSYILSASRRIASVNAVRRSDPIKYSDPKYRDQHVMIQDYIDGIKHGLLVLDKAGAKMTKDAMAVWDISLGINRNSWEQAAQTNKALKLLLASIDIATAQMLSAGAITNILGGHFPIAALAGTANWGRALVTVNKAKMGDKDAQFLLDAIEELGGFTEKILGGLAEVQSSDVKVKKAMALELKVLQFEGANRFLNKVASIAALYYLNDRITRIGHGHSRSKFYKKEMIRNFGWTEQEINKIVLNGYATEMQTAQIIQTFVAQANVYRINPLDIPIWMQSDIGRRIVSLSSFFRSMGYITMDGIQEARDGNPRKLLTMLFGGTLSEIVVDTVRDFLKDKDNDFWDTLYLALFGGSVLGILGLLYTSIVWKFRMGDTVTEALMEKFLPPQIGWFRDFERQIREVIKHNDPKAWAGITKQVPVTRMALTTEERIRKWDWDVEVFESRKRGRKSVKPFTSPVQPLQ